jgi:hypothetical protein
MNVCAECGKVIKRGKFVRLSFMEIPDEGAYDGGQWNPSEIEHFDFCGVGCVGKYIGEVNNV